MASLNNTAEGGSNGTTVTTGNSGGSSGNAWSAVTGAGGTAIFDNTHPAHGSLGYKVINAAGVVKYAQWAVTADTAPKFRYYIYLTANPPAIAVLARMLNGAGVAMSFRVGGTGFGSFTDATGVGVATTANALPLNQLIRVEFEVTCSTTVGTLVARFYNGDETTPFDTLSVGSLNTDTQVDTIRVGVVNAVASATTVWFDSVAYSSVGQPGPLAPLGSQASYTVTANAGTPLVKPVGSQPSTTVTANAGTPVVVVAGSQASTTVTANAGSASAVTGYSAVLLAIGALAYHRLGDASGTTNTDSSGNGRHGTYDNTPLLGETAVIYGDADTAVTLRAAQSESVSSANDAALQALNQAQVIWFRNPDSGGPTLLSDSSTGSRWNLTIMPPSSGFQCQLQFSFPNAANFDPPTGVDLFDGNRHKVAWKTTASFVDIWVDGVNVYHVDRTGWQTGATAPNGVWRLGANSLFPTQYFDVTVDEWSLHSSLSDADVAALWAAGTPAGVTVSGSQATVTVTANAGSAVVVKAGSQATETDTPNAGSLLVKQTGSKPTETDTANGGTPQVRTSGSLATVTDSGLAGSPQTTTGASQAAETDTAQGGTAAVRTAGALATETDTAQGGAAAVAFSGSQPAVTVTANGGVPLVVVAGGLADETDSGIHGGATGHPLGDQGFETDTANAGTPAVVVAGSQATVTDSGLAGSPQVGVAGGRGDTAASGLPGVPLVVVAGSQWVETDSALIGAVSGGFVIEGDMAFVIIIARSGSVLVDIPITPADRRYVVPATNHRYVVPAVPEDTEDEDRTFVVPGQDRTVVVT